MDPLSLTASIIAVTGAAHSALHGIQRLARIREAPEQVLQLQNEVSDASVIIAAVKETIQRRDETRADESINQHIRRLVEKTSGILSEITAVAEAGLINYSEDTPADIPNVRIRLRNISLETSDIKDRILTLSSGSAAAQSESTSLQELDNDQRSRMAALESISRDQIRSPNLQTTIRVRTAVHSGCRPLCACVCHKESRFSSPRWTENIVGSLFLGYSGIPSVGYFSPKCTEVACRRNDLALINVQYYFPSWFLQRALILRSRYSPLHGNQISVRTPRVVGAWTDIFVAALSGNIEMTILLLSQRKASPFDVGPDGSTPLYHAMRNINDGKGMELCRLLLREGADVEHKDMSLMAPVDRFWSIFLLAPSRNQNNSLKEIFSAAIDLGESLSKKRFTALHKIVLKLSNAKLEDQLQLSTAEIESKCSMGKTPLLWACEAGNIHAIRVLIRFGANVEATDHNGGTVFFRAVQTRSPASVSVLTTLIEEIRLRETSANGIVTLSQRGVSLHPSRATKKTDRYIRKLINTPTTGKYSMTPLKLAASFGLTDFVSLLLVLASGAETDVGATSSSIEYAIQWNSHAILELLLRHEPRMDSVNGGLNNILHIATKGDFQTISILFQRGLCCIDTKSLNARGNTPLESFEVERPAYLSEDEATKLIRRCKDLFLQLLESIEIRTATAGHDCWKGRWERRAANSNGTMSENSDSSDEDEFFDAQSNHGADTASIEETGDVVTGAD